MMLHVALLVVLAVSSAGPGLAPADLVLLLEIGVSESEIIAFADGRGGFEPVDAANWEAIESLRAGDRLRSRLVRVASGFGALSALARTSEVYQDGESGLSFVYPAGWVVARAAPAKGGLIFRIAPRSAGESRVFLTPCIFLFFQEESGLVPEAVEPALWEVRQMVLRRLREAGMRPATAPSERTSFLGGSRESFRIEAAVDGGSVGVIEIALIVDGQGRAAGVGFTAPAGDRVATAEAFERVAKSVALR